MNSKIALLQEAKSEAKRFIKKADLAIARLESDNMASISGCKELASAKRASMDLTRVLAEVRKPWMGR